MGYVVNLIVILGLVGLLLFKERCHNLERKELLNRIMAKDLTEYQKTECHKPSGGGNFIKNSINNIDKRMNQ